MVSAKTKPGLGIPQNLTVETDEASRGNSFVFFKILSIVTTFSTMKNNICQIEKRPDNYLQVDFGFKMPAKSFLELELVVSYNPFSRFYQPS